MYLRVLPLRIHTCLLQNAGKAKIHSIFSLPVFLHKDTLWSFVIFLSSLSCLFFASEMSEGAAF